MKKIVLSAILLSISSFSMADGINQGPTKGLALRDFVQKTNTCIGNFEERIIKKDKVVKVSFGNFWWKQGAWRWDYLKRDNSPDIITIDTEENSIQIDNDLEQAVINKPILSSTPIGVFTSKKNASNFDSKYVSENDCCEVFEIKMKQKLDSDKVVTDSANVWIDKKSLEPKKITYDAPTGEHVEVLISKVQVNAKVPDTVFKFEAKNMDVIDNTKD